jgi:hypothetical protein
MYLIYMDGTGNTGARLDHPTSTVHYIVGLAIPGDSARALENDVTLVLRPRFGDRVDEPGFECKGSDMYRGEGPCARMPPGERVRLYGELLALLPDHDVRLIWRGIRKPELARRYVTPIHPHTLAFLYFVEEVERFLRHRKEFGLLISDEEKSVEQQVIEDLPRYKDLGTNFGWKPLPLTRIVDNVHWIRSHDSRLLQLADNCTFLCQRIQRDAGKTTLNALAVQELWKIVGGQVHSGVLWP